MSEAERSWRDYMRDMLEYLGHASRFAEGVSLEDFEANTEKYLAVSRALEIAGEAAKQVPDDIRAKFPQVEWRKITGIRDVLAHAYLQLKSEIIWDAAVNKAPGTCRELIRILADNPE